MLQLNPNVDRRHLVSLLKPQSGRFYFALRFHSYTSLFARFPLFLSIRRIAYECPWRLLRFLLRRGNSIHPMSEVDQCSLKALVSLRLTPREAEVLFWISEGKTNQDIGIILGATTGTICKHVEHILSKLNVENRTAAAVLALKTCSSFGQRPEKIWTPPRAALAGYG